jgi:hypothetical protein
MKADAVAIGGLKDPQVRDHAKPLQLPVKILSKRDRMSFKQNRTCDFESRSIR